MSSSQEVILIVDVDDSSASFSNGWQFVEDPTCYGGKAAFATFNPAENALEMNMSFQGTSISLYGTVSSSMVTLDDNDPVLSTGQPNERSIWYQSAPLPDKEHKVGVISNEVSMYIDYALVKAGSTTDLSAKAIFVDDAKKDEIWYTGQWSASAVNSFHHVAPNKTGGLMDWLAADSTTTYSEASGDSFEFRFSGTSISVYGILSEKRSSTVDFIIDGSAERREYLYDSNSGVSDMVTITNYKFYENTTLNPGNHTLIVNVVNLPRYNFFQFDYITYTPSFSFVHEKPTFIRGSGDQQVTPSSAVPPYSPAVSPSSLNSPPRQSLGLPIGAIVGIVIAGLSMAITGFFYHCRRKRSTLRREVLVPNVEPFATRLARDSEPKPRKFFPSENTANSSDPMDEGGSHLTSLRIPQSMTEVQQRNDEIASLTAEMQNLDNPTRGELFARINMLTLEVERLVRENAPPEYEGSEVGQRPSSRSATLPSYDSRDGA
ncbi:hypothetical protein VNI00_018561 [Paramarasmius palmivorus]|uniref:Transmembrane protein n=1 Tax=Paramarasmius palmivorus TaxID=297713 RepID=A0AAW0AX02_9AGAR